MSLIHCWPDSQEEKKKKKTVETTTKKDKFMGLVSKVIYLY